MSYQGFPNYETWAAILAIGNSPCYNEFIGIKQQDLPEFVQAAFPRGIEAHQPGKYIDLSAVDWRWVAGYVELQAQEEATPHA